MPAHLLIVHLAVAACSAAACVGSAASQQERAIVPLVDHHQHLLSPRLARLWKEPATVAADTLIAQLDAAGISRAAVLSLAYAHGSPVNQGADEYQRVRAENDWTAEQAALYPRRLRAVCSVNPVRDYALTEIARCASVAGLRTGLKMQFANSGVDLRDRSHVARLREVFAAAASRRMAIIAHVWTGDDQIGKPFGRAEALTFLNEILPAAPDVPIQIAHLGGSGPRLDPGTKDAMIALAEAAAAQQPRMRNVYFDITTNVVGRSRPADAEFVTARIRQIGVRRIVYGSDMTVGGNAPARESWQAHLTKLALTTAEFRTIATNVAPYMRE